MLVFTLFALISIIKFVVVAIIVTNIALLVGFLLLLTYSRKYQSGDAETNLQICLESLQNPIANLFTMDRNLSYSNSIQVLKDNQETCKTPIRSCFCDGDEDINSNFHSLHKKSTIGSTANTPHKLPRGVCMGFEKIKAQAHEDDSSVGKNDEDDDLDSLYHWSSTLNYCSENNNYTNENRPYLLAIDNITDMSLFCCQENAHEEAERSLSIFSENSKGKQMDSINLNTQATEVDMVPHRVSTGLNADQKKSDQALYESSMNILTTTLTMTSECLSASSLSLAFADKMTHQSYQICRHSC
ncbi:unnamed protein product [Phytomonas sp. Hart1]|nr:unnamed protein product [Phytomonas sp. Hart1]|eukprot:CCW68499.1 unnamed protein product [Phytomonas sp. isolate Hart1]